MNLKDFQFEDFYALKTELIYKSKIFILHMDGGYYFDDDKEYNVSPGELAIKYDACHLTAYNALRNGLEVLSEENFKSFDVISSIEFTKPDELLIMGIAKETSDWLEYLFVKPIISGSFKTTKLIGSTSD